MRTPDPDAFDTIIRLGASALAWEILRRDPAYCAAVADLTTPLQPNVAADRDFAARWGLHFR